MALGTVAIEFPALGLCKSRASSPLFPSKGYPKGISPYMTVDLLAAAGCSLRWIMPCMLSIPRKRAQLVQVWKAESTDPTVRKANLSARRNERIQLPVYTDSIGMAQPISKFLSNPLGIKAVLNTKALQRFECLGPDTYRCTLQRIKFLNFEVAPILDIQVTTTSEECIVEMLSCRFEGSEILERQNKHFSACAKSSINWDVNCEEPFLDINVELSVILEVYTRPFSLLPISAVETPGNIIMQTLVDSLVPPFLEQLLEDYQNWAQMDTCYSERYSLASFRKSDIEFDESEGSSESSHSQ